VEKAYSDSAGESSLRVAPELCIGRSAYETLRNLFQQERGWAKPSNCSLFSNLFVLLEKYGCPHTPRKLQKIIMGSRK
jgi:hypothetical protein